MLNEKNVYCVKCGCKLKNTDSFCSNCGHSLNSYGKRKKVFPVICLICLILIILCVIILGELIEKKATTKGEKSRTEVFDDSEEKNTIKKNKSEISDSYAEEQRFLEEKEIDIFKCNNLLGLLSDLSEVFIENGIDEAESVDKINSICQGDPESVLWFLGYNIDWPPHMPPLEGLSKTDFENRYYLYCYTKEQVDTIVYSLTGKDIDFENLETFMYDGEECVGFGTPSGNSKGGSLENMKIEYIGDGVWNIYAEIYVEHYIINCVAYKVADIVFQVGVEEDSCYDGYRVLGVEELKFCDWQKAFREFILDNELYIHKSYYVIQLDDDGIPEIYVTGFSFADGDRLLYYKNGVVYEEIMGIASTEFVEKQGVLMNCVGKDTTWRDTIYRLGHDKLEKVGEGNYYVGWDSEANMLQDADGNIIMYEGSNWNGHAVSNSKEFEELKDETIRNLDVDKRQWMNICDERFYVGDADTILYNILN